MRGALHIAGARADALQSHGFAFLWKDHSPDAHATYSISMVHAAPFQSFGRVLQRLPETSPLGLMQKKILRIAQEHEPKGHSPTLDIISDYIKKSLKNVAFPLLEGAYTWDILEEIMMHQSNGDLISFAGWGRFGKRFDEIVMEKLKRGDRLDYSGDVATGIQVVNELLSRKEPPPLWHRDQENRFPDLPF